MRMKNFVLCICLILSIAGFAQPDNGIDKDLQSLAKESDPIRAVSIMKRIVQKYRLNTVKDAETFDMMNGTVAIAYVMHKDYRHFDQYIDSIRNKFNQTSFLNMAASKLLEANIDNSKALELARKTIDVYLDYKDDPSAKPASFSNEDWKRFMDFAQYPYYDTYAHALFSVKKYPEAMIYQEKAFDASPEEGLPSSVERYAKLLQLNGNKEAAKQLLTKVAALGKLNKSMIDQLKKIYIDEHGNADSFDDYLYDLQVNARAELKRILKKKILNETAPAFTLKNINGQNVNLSDYKGKIVVLDLWATWCKPCIASFPAMQKMKDKYTEVVFLFIAVKESGEDALERVKKFIQKNKYNFTVLMDEPVKPKSSQYKITSSYKPEGIPAKYIIDKNGILRFRSGGFDTDSQLINELEAMLAIVDEL